jgi:pimeloyl-ACP methyl ester carboxylesterase
MGAAAMSRSVTHHPGALQTSTRLAAVARTGQHPRVPDAEPLPLTVAGRRLEAAELRGDAHRRPFVLLHEGLGSVALWRGFPQALQAATGRRVIAFSRFGHGRSEPPPFPRTPAFFHEEALEVLPEVLAQLDAPAPLLVGHSDGGSIALIHAARRPVPGIALLAPHVIVEDVTVAAIREAREAYDRGDLRERMTRHHDDPDAAFNGWCDVWLDPGFRDWSLESEAERVTCPVLLIQGADDPYGTLDQLDRIEAKVRGPVERLVVPGGHSPHLEAGREVVAALVRWAGDR